jgi:hypothetical protein
MILEDRIKINASANKVFNWLIEHMKDTESYQKWHPEHKVMEWVKGNPMEQGSIAYCEEYLQENLQKLKFKFVKIIPNKLIEYRVLFPLSIIAPCNKFIIEETGKESCILIAFGKINMSEKLFLKSHKEHANKMKQTKRHMKEEGENIKKSLEKMSK